MKFHENPSSGRRVVPCRQMYGRTATQTRMTKLRVSFCNFSNAPENRRRNLYLLQRWVGSYNFTSACTICVRCFFQCSS